MRFRKKITRFRSKRLFRKTAAKVNKKNFVMPNRGGLRM